jgi:hypothetical protein
MGKRRRFNIAILVRGPVTITVTGPAIAALILGLTLILLIVTQTTGH